MSESQSCCQGVLPGWAVGCFALSACCGLHVESRWMGVRPAELEQHLAAED